MSMFLPVNPVPKPKCLNTFLQEKNASTPNHLWSHLSLVFITDLHNSDSNILVIINRFSRRCSWFLWPDHQWLLTSLNWCSTRCFAFLAYQRMWLVTGPHFMSQVRNRFLEKLMGHVQFDAWVSSSSQVEQPGGLGLLLPMGWVCLEPLEVHISLVHVGLPTATFSMERNAHKFPWCQWLVSAQRVGLREHASAVGAGCSYQQASC